MEAVKKTSQVVIIGGGVAGLSLALFLERAGIGSVVLERYKRADIEAHHRAGYLDGDAVAILDRWGVVDKLPEEPPPNGFEIRINGKAKPFDQPEDGGTQGRFCTQQQLVTNFLAELIEEMGCDVRFEVADVTIENRENCPSVTFRDAAGLHRIDCNYVAGCDGGHSVSRSFIPQGVLTEYSYEFGYAWLAALVEAPLNGPSVMAVSDHGLAAQITRGRDRNRVYLQCPLSDGVEDWPDERIWSELRLRFGNESLDSSGAIRGKDIVPLRSVMYTPMQHRNLFLAGDAAHLVPPTAAKGMSLALHDVDALAKAMLRALKDGDDAGLRSYSETVIPHIWKEQEMSASATDTFHDAGDPTLHGTFRQMIARKRLEDMFASPPAASQESE